MRGRLIFPFLAEICRLDTAAMAGLAASGAGSRDSAYDPDFKEAVLVDADQDGIAEPLRREFPPVRTLCQIEPETLDALRMLDAGNAPRSRLLLVFHFRDLERMGLVDVSTGEALIHPSDRLSAIYELSGKLVQAIRTPPGLYVTESRPIGFGLHRARPARNLLLVTFEDRSPTRSNQ